MALDRFENETDFIPCSRGIDYGWLGPDCSAALGCHDKPIRLQKGNSQWGAVHIAERHGDIIEYGYEYIEDLVIDIVDNFIGIHEAQKNRMMMVLYGHLAVGSSKMNYVMVIRELPKFWSITTAYEMRTNKKIKGRRLWQRSEPAVSGPGLTAPSSVPSDSDKSVD